MRLCKNLEDQVHLLWISFREDATSTGAACPPLALMALIPNRKSSLLHSLELTTGRLWARLSCILGWYDSNSGDGSHCRVL